MRALSCIRGNKVFDASSLFHVPNGFAYYVAQDIHQMSRINVKQSTAPSAKLRALPSTMQGAQKSPMFD